MSDVIHAFDKDGHWSRFSIQIDFRHFQDVVNTAQSHLSAAEGTSDLLNPSQPDIIIPKIKVLFFVVNIFCGTSVLVLTEINSTNRVRRSWKNISDAPLKFMNCSRIYPKVFKLFLPSFLICDKSVSPWVSL